MATSSTANRVRSQSARLFTEDDQQTWRAIYSGHSASRNQQVYSIFNEGLNILHINGQEIPDLAKINEILKALTGWEGVYVDGLEKGDSFYRMLANRQFPIGNFIRSKEDLTYTPEPDIVHDLYGHLPFFANPEYAQFCQQFGAMACDFLDREDLLRQCERFFWFTIEFGLINTSTGPQIFGAGIASSTGECAYALSEKPEVIPFDIDTIRHQEFRIDIMQTKLFILQDTAQLYASLPTLKQRIQQDR